MPNTEYKPQEVYDKYVYLKKALANNVTNKGVTASETELYDNLINKVAQIENLKGEERTLENFTDVLNEPKSIVQLEYPEPKNLFDIDNPIYGALSKANTAFLPTIKDDVISFNTYYAQRGGSGFVIPVEPNTTITISFDSVGSDYWTEIMAVESILDNVAINFYKYPQLKNVTKYTLTQQAGKHYILFILDGVDGYYTAKIKNLQIEKGSTATPYEPYTKTLNAKLGTVNLFTPNTTPTVPSNMGVTCTYDSADNTFTVNGTLAVEGNITLATLDIPTDDYYIVRYYVSGDITVPEGIAYQSLFAMFKYNSTSEYATRLTQTVGNAKTSQITVLTTAVRMPQGDRWTFYMQNFGVGTVFDNYKFKIAVIKKDIYYTGIPFTPYISDLSTVNVTRCGKTLFDVSKSVGFQSYYSGVTSTISGTTITTSSTANRSCQLLLGEFPAGTYTISFSNTDFALLMLQYGEALGQLSRLDNVNFVSTKSHTFTLTQPRKLWLESTIATNTTKTITDIQLELGSAATSYEPYQGQTYTPTATGEVTGITNLYPTTTLLTNNAGVVFEQVTGGTYKEILPSTDKNGITKVYQPSVDNTIDGNIKPENIKKDVSMLGVTGDYICNYTYNETTKELVLIL